MFHTEKLLGQQLSPAQIFSILTKPDAVQEYGGYLYE